jgi:hypothetical protein
LLVEMLLLEHAWYFVMMTAHEVGPLFVAQGCSRPSFVHATTWTTQKKSGYGKG